MKTVREYIAEKMSNPAKAKRIEAMRVRLKAACEAARKAGR